MKTVLTILAAVLPFGLAAQSEDAQRRRNFNTDNYVALREFDPVSYFKSRPLKGDPRFEHEYKGITYYFANAENLAAFGKEPAKYEPAYGGWCAYTVALNGQRVKILPTSYKIIDGRLHLFHNFGGDDRLRKWNAGDQKALKAAAGKNWIKHMR